MIEKGLFLCFLFPWPTILLLISHGNYRPDMSATQTNILFSIITFCACWGEVGVHGTPYIPCCLGAVWHWQKFDHREWIPAQHCLDSGESSPISSMDNNTLDIVGQYGAREWPLVGSPANILRSCILKGIAVNNDLLYLGAKMTSVMEALWFSPIAD